MVESLQRGDEIITNGGVLGLILNVSESYVIVEIAPTIEITLLKSSVQTLLPKGTLKSIEPKGGKSHKNKAIKPTSVADNLKAEESSETASNKDDETEKK